MSTFARQQPDDLKLRDNDPAFPNAGILDTIFLRTAAVPFLTAIVPQVFAVDGGAAADGRFGVNVRVLLTLPRPVQQGFELELAGDWPGAAAARLTVCAEGCDAAIETEVSAVLTAQVSRAQRWCCLLYTSPSPRDS